MKDRTTVHNGVKVLHHWTASTFQLTSGRTLSLTGWTFFVDGDNYPTLPAAIEATEHEDSQ